MKQSIPASIEQLEKRLKIDLPGKIAQYKMAPSDRVQRDLKMHGKPTKESAVLILLFPKDKELHLLLIQRASYNGPHSGQIAFPGGKFEKLDSNLVSTAIRETFEELQIDAKTYKIIGALSPLIIPVSQTMVYPFVAFSEKIPSFKVDGFEVTDVYILPMSFFLTESNIKIYTNNELSYPFFDFAGKRIWGATAMMIAELKFLFQNK
ncbi:MAG: CoA pyrophosphatase [Bacteroidales bacterium]|nr:CoA pyrophosphatase [Bacteroidales bacterium]